MDDLEDQLTKLREERRQLLKTLRKPMTAGHLRAQQLLHRIHALEWIQVETEKQALVLQIHNLRLRLHTPPPSTRSIGTQTTHSETRANDPHQ